jgi:hypothetical protein
VARVAATYLFPTQPKPYLATAMRATISRDEQDRALAGVVAEWLTEGAGVDLPKAAVQQVRGVGRMVLVDADGVCEGRWGRGGRASM